MEPAQYRKWESRMKAENLIRVANKDLRNVVTDYGFRITAPGFISVRDAEVWRTDLQALVREVGRRRFGILVDIRGQKANPLGATEIIKDVMKWLRACGCERSAVVLDNPLALIQIRRLAQETGVYAYERYIDARSVPDWEKVALEWLNLGIDPDTRQYPA